MFGGFSLSSLSFQGFEVQGFQGSGILGSIWDPEFVASGIPGFRSSGFLGWATGLGVPYRFPFTVYRRLGGRGIPGVKDSWGGPWAWGSPTVSCSPTLCLCLS